MPKPDPETGDTRFRWIRDGGKAAEVRERSAQLLARVRDRLRNRKVPTWLLGGLVALFTWRLGFPTPIIGLDPSWNAGLYMAVHRGLAFGTQIIFTYGPLGFLRYTGLWYSDLAVISFCFSALLYVALCCSLVWALRRTFGAAAAAACAFFVLAMIPNVEQPIALTVLGCLGALSWIRPKYALEGLLVGGASFAAVESLVKLSTGPVVFAACLIALIGLRARWWQVSAFLALFAAEVALLWWAAGQTLSDFPDYLRNGWEVVSGYSAAMSVNSAPLSWKLLAYIAFAGILCAAAAGRYRDSRARWCAVAAAGVAAFAMLKEGVVRYDADHIAIYFSTACAIWLAIPWPQARRWLLVSGAVALGAVAIHQVPLTPNVDVIGNVKRAKDAAVILSSPSKRAGMIDQARFGMALTYQLEPAILSRLRGHSVDIDPWEAGVAWAYDLDWSPLPVFQNYSAYTARLDALNAAEAASLSGPERILRENPSLVDPAYQSRSIDDRNPAWDPPEQARAILCNFVPLHTTSRWQVLGRIRDRCGRPKSAGTVDAEPGVPVPVPVPAKGEVCSSASATRECRGSSICATFCTRQSFAMRCSTARGNTD